MAGMEDVEAVDGDDDVLVDLDVLRVARLEVAGVRKIRFGGRVWVLTPELPFMAAELWRQGVRRGVVELVLADPAEVDEFVALRPTEQDVGNLFRAFGFTVGKPPASSSSSTDGG